MKKQPMVINGAEIKCLECGSTDIGIYVSEVQFSEQHSLKDIIELADKKSEDGSHGVHIAMYEKMIPTMSKGEVLYRTNRYSRDVVTHELNYKYVLTCKCGNLKLDINAILGMLFLFKCQSHELIISSNSIKKEKMQYDIAGASLVPFIKEDGSIGLQLKGKVNKYEGETHKNYVITSEIIGYKNGVFETTNSYYKIDRVLEEHINSIPDYLKKEEPCQQDLM